MKKLLFFVITLLLTLNAEILNLKPGWQLKGSSTGVTDLSVFNNPNIQAVWTYEEGKWYVLLPNNPDLMNNLSSNVGSLTYIKPNDGFWIYSQDFIDIDINNENDTKIYVDNIIFDNSDVSIIPQPISLNNISNNTFYLDAYSKIVFDDEGNGIISYIYNTESGKCSLVNGIIFCERSFNNGEYNDTIALRKLDESNDSIVFALYDINLENKKATYSKLIAFVKDEENITIQLPFNFYSDEKCEEIYFNNQYKTNFIGEDINFSLNNNILNLKFIASSVSSYGYENWYMFNLNGNYYKVDENISIIDNLNNYYVLKISKSFKESYKDLNLKNKSWNDLFYEGYKIDMFPYFILSNNTITMDYFDSSLEIKSYKITGNILNIVIFNKNYNSMINYYYILDNEIGEISGYNQFYYHNYYRVVSKNMLLKCITTTTTTNTIPTTE